MRLPILDDGHTLPSRAFFLMLRAMSGQAVPAVVKLLTYRGNYFGSPMKAVTQEAMRGPSAWSVGDRELMAAVVSKANSCQYCVNAHSAVATKAYKNPEKVSATLKNLDSAELEAPLRATLKMLDKLTREGQVSAEDMRAVLDAGATRAQIEDALAVAYSFNVINRLADSFGFAVPGPKAFEVAAKFLLAIGYR